MPYAHKPVMYRDSDYNTSAYCSVCGQENLDTECPGEYVLKPSEQAAIDKRFSDDMNKIFGLAVLNKSYTSFDDKG